MKLDAIIALMKNLPLFTGFSDDELKLIAFGAQELIVQRAEVLFHAGDRADGAYLVATGILALHRPDVENIGASGNAKDIISRCGPGMLINEMALLIRTERSFSCTALHSATVFEFKRFQFARVLQEYPLHAERLRRLYMHRMRKTGRHLDMMLDAVKERKQSPQ